MLVWTWTWTLPGARAHALLKQFPASHGAKTLPFLHLAHRAALLQTQDLRTLWCHLAPAARARNLDHAARSRSNCHPIGWLLPPSDPVDTS